MPLQECASACASCLSRTSAPLCVQWVGLKDAFNTWLSRELLESLGFEKLVHEMDAKEVARLGLYSRPCTIAGVQDHFNDFGLDAEFGTYGQIKNLSGENMGGMQLSRSASGSTAVGIEP